MKNPIKKIIKTGLLLMIAGYSFAQTRISNGGVPAAANSNAILELTSIANNKGLLMPKVALTSTTAASPLSVHVAGMIVYNTATAGTAPNNVVPGIYYNNGSSWDRMTTNAPTVGDIKPSSQTADHNGWYLLNGRTKASLPTQAQVNASSLGFGANLPDATDRFIKAKTGAEVLGSAGGSTGFSLTQANLPAITYTGTTPVNGAHSHSYINSGTNTIWVNVGSGVTVGDNDVNPPVTFNTSTAGAHTHTISVSTGGSGTTNTTKPVNLVTNYFVYLGN